MKKLWLYGAAATAALMLVSCSNGPDAPEGTPPVTPSPTTLSSFMATLFASTNETAVPTDINSLQLDTSSEDPTQFNALII